MRRYPKSLLLALVALALQILAPIAASWATAIVASDPLQSAEICHSTSDQNGGQPAHSGICAICCALHAIPSIDTPPQVALAIPYRQTAPVVWIRFAPRRSPSGVGSNMQARAPPLSM